MQFGVGFMRGPRQEVSRSPGPKVPSSLLWAGAPRCDLCPMPKQPKLNGTGKKPPTPSVKVRIGRTPLEQRSGRKPLDAQGHQTGEKKGGAVVALWMFQRI